MREYRIIILWKFLTINYLRFCYDDVYVITWLAYSLGDMLTWNKGKWFEGVFFHVLGQDYFLAWAIIKFAYAFKLPHCACPAFSVHDCTVKYVFSPMCNKRRSRPRPEMEWALLNNWPSPKPWNNIGNYVVQAHMKYPNKKLWRCGLESKRCFLFLFFHISWT